MHFRVYLEAQKNVPPASNIGDDAMDYYVLVGVAFKKQHFPEACVNGSANISQRYGDASAASTAPHEKDRDRLKHYIFTEPETTLHCASRLRTRLLWQAMLHADGTVSLLRFDLSKSFAPRETYDEPRDYPFSGLTSLWACNVVVFCT